jgi:hypothetical protein
MDDDMARKKGNKKGNQKKRSKEAVGTFADAYKALQTNPPDSTHLNASSPDISCVNEHSIPIDAYYEEHSLELDTDRNEAPPFSVLERTLSNDLTAGLSPNDHTSSFHQTSQNQEQNLPKPITVALAGASHYGGFSSGKVSFYAEPSNPYDHNAVAVFQNERMIGHLPRVLVANLAKRKAVLDHGCGTIAPFDGIHITFNYTHLATPSSSATSFDTASLPNNTIKKPQSSSKLTKPKDTMKLLEVNINGNYLTIKTDQGDFKNRIDYSHSNIIEKCKKHIGRNIKLNVRAGTGAGGKTWKELGWFIDITEAESETKPVHKKSEVHSFEARLPFGIPFDEHVSQKVFGPPGTGKTTLMLQYVSAQLDAGVLPENIAFISFSNAGANAAKKKVSDKLPGYGAIDFPNFSTMHSLATKIGGGLGKTLCQEEHWKAFDKTIICYNEWTEVNDTSSIVVRFKHPVLDMNSLAISRRTSFAIEYDQSLVSDPRAKRAINESLSHYFDKRISPDQTVNYANKYLQAYTAYKDERNLVDFNDVIERIISDEFDDAYMPTFELLIIDEAQDLSDFLWVFANKLISRAKRVYIAGDDDQAIMINFGASPHAFLRLKTTETDYPLPRSYRVPEAVMDYIRSGTLKYIEALPERVKKVWDTADHHGTVSPHSNRAIQNQTDNSTNVQYESFTINDLIQRIIKSPDEEWLIMAPTKATGQNFSTALLEQQPQVAHFYRNKPYPNLSEANNCKIRVQTVHTSKGDEAKNVAIIAESFGDVMMLVKDPRLAYVALTRAREVMYPRVIKEGLLPEMHGAGKQWGHAASLYNDMFPGQ